MSESRNWFELHPDEVVFMDEIAARIGMKKGTAYEFVVKPDCPLITFKNGKRRVSYKRLAEEYLAGLEAAARAA